MNGLTKKGVEGGLGFSPVSCVAGLTDIKERISGLSSELREPTSSTKLKRQKEHESTPVEARH